MLYVFQMDVGQMLTLDISLLMGTVSNLQREIARVTGIGVDLQILLLSGGHSLNPNHKVISYGAGADTNPVFLFSKLAITSQEPPLVRSMGVSKEIMLNLKERVTEAVKLPVSFETVNACTSLAVSIRDNAARVLTFCNNEFKEQHLQHQGWSAVVANLEEIAQALQKTKSKFSKMFGVFVPLRENYFTMLSNFKTSLELLKRIPLLKPLREAEGETPRDPSGRGSVSCDSDVMGVVAPPPAPGNLLEWITSQSQGQSLENLQLKCYNDLVFFNEDRLDQFERDVLDLCDQVDADEQMKSLAGIERRLSDLEKRLNEARKIAKVQGDIAQGFMNHKSRLTSNPDPSVLPDLCGSHRKQLVQLLEGNQRLDALQSNFCRSKQEMSTNIHHRLGWVVLVETKIAKLDSELIIHMKTLRQLEGSMDLLGQVAAAPSVYAQMVVEAHRRRGWAGGFDKWSEALVCDSGSMYEAELDHRMTFARRMGQHFFLHTLFKGFEDVPPNFATMTPAPFDQHLPHITMEDITMLRGAVPELMEPLSLPMSIKSFPSSSSRQDPDSAICVNSCLPHSQSSQTDWSLTPDVSTTPDVFTTPQPAPSLVPVVKATEATPTRFCPYDLQDSRSTEYLPAVSSLTDTMRDVIMADTCAESPNQTSGSDQASQTDTVRTKGTSDLTSPLSSTEFATADFYFEDAMPSPTRSRSDSENIAALQAELLQKVKQIREMEELLRRSERKNEEDTVLDVVDTSSSLTLVADVFKQAESTLTVSESSDSEGVTVLAVDSHTDRCFNCQRIQQECIDVSQKLSESESTIADLQKTMETAERDSTSQKADYQDRLVQQKLGISKLEIRLTENHTELEEMSAELEKKKSDVKTLEACLHISSDRCEELTHEKADADDSLEGVRAKLCEVRDITKGQLSSHRTSLGDLRSYILKNRNDLNSSLASVLKSVEEGVKRFNNSVVADLHVTFKKEADALKMENLRLKADVATLECEHRVQVETMQKQGDELQSRLLDSQSHYTRKYEDQQAAFDSTVKELETKHSLELELELDKMRSDLGRSMEEIIEARDALAREVEEVESQIEKFKVTAEEEKSQIQAKHHLDLEDKRRGQQGHIEEACSELKLQLQKDNEKRIADKDMEMQALKVKIDQFDSRLEEVKDDHRREVEAEKKEAERQREGHEEEMGRLGEQLQRDKSQLEEDHSQQMSKLEEEHRAALEILIGEHRCQMEALSAERGVEMNIMAEKHKVIVEDLKQDHRVEVEDLTERLDGQKEEIGRCLEENHLGYANKLTELKTQFDFEREGLLAEIKKVKGQAMTSSETQTQLLAEVISLNSSASYGSEEMIAPRKAAEEWPPSVPVGSPPSTPPKSLQPVEELREELELAHVQIRSATDKLTEYETKLAKLRQENELLSKVKDEVTSPGSEFERSEVTEVSRSEVMTGSTLSTLTDNSTSFYVMDKDMQNASFTTSMFSTISENDVKFRDDKIANLEKKLMEMSMTTADRQTISDKVSIKCVEAGDLVLLCLDETHDHYVVFTIGTNLHFLHTESLEGLGLRRERDRAARKTWILAQVEDKEYCLAKKSNNRFKVPQGTCFYRVKCRPWTSDRMSEGKGQGVTGRSHRVRGERSGGASGGARPKTKS